MTRLQAALVAPIALLAVLACSGPMRTNPLDPDADSSAQASNAGLRPYRVPRVYVLTQVDVPMTNVFSNQFLETSNGVTNLVWRSGTNTFASVPTNLAFTTGSLDSEFEVSADFYAFGASTSAPSRRYSLSGQHLFRMEYGGANALLSRYALGMGPAQFQTNLSPLALPDNPYLRFQGSNGLLWVSTGTNLLTGFETNRFMPVSNLALPIPASEPSLDLGSLWFDGRTAFYFCGRTLLRAENGVALWSNRVFPTGPFTSARSCWNGGSNLVVLTDFDKYAPRTRATLVRASDGAVLATVDTLGLASDLGGLRPQENKVVAMEAYKETYLLFTQNDLGGGAYGLLRSLTGTNAVGRILASPPLGSYLPMVGTPGLLAQPQSRGESGMTGATGTIRYWQAAF